MRAGLTIGEFSQLTHLSVRTLRRYHEGGLLEPAQVDPGSGYRYYAGDQIPAAQVIHRLRELEMPLAEVREVLATDDPDARANLLAGHLARLEGELDRTRAAVRSLRRLLQPEPAPLDVELRSVPVQQVTAVQDTVAIEDVLDWYSGAMAELDAALRGSADVGPPGGVYENALFTEDRGHVLVYRQVRDISAIGRVEPAELPAVELAVTTHIGDHDDIAVTYGALGAYVASRAPRRGGPRPRELPHRSTGRRPVRVVAHRDRLAGLPRRRRRLTGAAPCAPLDALANAKDLPAGEWLIATPRREVFALCWWELLAAAAAAEAGRVAAGSVAGVAAGHAVAVAAGGAARGEPVERATGARERRSVGGGGSARATGGHHDSCCGSADGERGALGDDAGGAGLAVTVLHEGTPELREPVRPGETD